MNELEVKRVPFMGTDLMAAKDESGTIWAGVRWMCDGMGLSKGQRDRQITNINADSVISKGLQICGSLPQAANRAFCA